MDDKKAFGVIQAIGKRLAGDPEAFARVRSAASAEDLAAALRDVGGLPEPLLEEFLASHVTPEGLDRVRAKIVLATKFALGLVKKGMGHEGGSKGVRPSGP